MNSTYRSRVALIAAVAKNGIIGRGGTLPWHLSADLKHFKALTTGRRIVMGRRTWESFPRPLPHREHVVVSSRAVNVPEAVVVVASLAAALSLPDPTDPVFVIGGYALYAEALAVADDLYLTEIEAQVEGDTYFPNWSRNAFHEVSREHHAAPLVTGGESVSFDFVQYTRNVARP